MPRNIKTIILFLLLISFLPLNYSKAAPIISNTNNAIVETSRFTIPLSATNEIIVNSLFDQGLIKNKTSFTALISKKTNLPSPGAYKINKNLSDTEVLKIIYGKPYMKWVVIPPGLRKEEIADLLTNNLGWTLTQKNKWINTYTRMKADYIEGVYFPDTYLIPVNETPLNVANRLVAKFNEKFTQYLPEFSKQNMQWTRGLTLASLVQREAANDADMPLIAGILWNRLKQKMPLGVDATLQYARGNKGNGWWALITIADKKLVSPYNTYKNTGLPPRPIANPGIPAIEAVLNPTKTDCLYYLHDKQKIIHCSKTYEEHLKNIDLYLKNTNKTN